MSKENVVEFYKAVVADEATQQQLRNADTTEAFINTTLELGQQKGYSFSRQEVEEVVRENTGPGSPRLSAAELEAVSGGTGVGCSNWSSSKISLCSTCLMC
ncbi:Nif11-like leader peptide family natural product precursor [Nostoc sp. PA-18-2419]|uniref:Nif11-like leader peptide family natural product precursor n=1 Tax=Nostoc sp. PA-18-2419 TaxID=2575443 RepID=UPI001108CF81|nr:Nif11-like leader peptide family natural product precursor [Nostoc sp. PA-18-2419]